VQAAGPAPGAARSAPAPRPADAELAAGRGATEGENARTRREPRERRGAPMLEELTRRDREREEALRLEAAKQAEAEAAEEAAPAGDLLLDDSFTAPRGASAAGLPEGAALVRLEGLSSTLDDDLKEYVCRDGDTWVGLAEIFYGDSRQAGLLRQFNEDRSALTAGVTLLLPVFDRRERAAAEVTTVASDGVELYTVQEGDSLWAIAKKVYGKGHLWERIHEANLDLLPRPEGVRPGMQLRIP